ncbi:MAG: PTS sugar transporter subunit IIA [Pedosphaera sp.]|nr:PTS sugar transporter subunit IIA [Pedosphaera sp.]
MILSEIITEKEFVLSELAATDRWGAINEMITRLIEVGKIKSEDREAIFESVKRREKSMGTGIGFGVAIPHACTNLIEQVVGILGRSRKGIDFDSLDNQPVNLIVLFLVPLGQFQKHLHTLASIAKLTHVREFRSSIEQAPDAESIVQAIRVQLARP